jgi:ABC-2 type transport system permease protein
LKLHRVNAVILRHAYEARHNANQIAYMVYLPVLNLLVWGFFTIYLAQNDHSRPGVINFLLGAVILWGMFSAFQRDMAVGVLEELWSRNLASLLASPLTAPEYLTGLVIVTFGKVSVGLIAECIVAWLFYKYNLFPLLLPIMPFLLNLVLFGTIIGILVMGVIFRYTTRFQALSWSIASILMPFSCVFYPISALPVVLRPAAWILPSTHSFEGMRQVLQQGNFSSFHFECGLALNLLYLAGAVGLFRLLFEAARSRGLLVRAQ